MQAAQNGHWLMPALAQSQVMQLLPDARQLTVVGRYSLVRFHST
jgi:hypothetical protein